MCHVNIISIIPILQKGKLRLNNQIIHPSSKSGSWNQIFSYHRLCFFHRSQSPINTCWVGLHWKWTCRQCLLYGWAGRDLGQCWEQKISWEVKWGSREFTVKWWRLAILPLPLTHPSPCEIWSYILTKKKKKKDIKHLKGRQVQLGAGQSGYKHWTKANRKQQRSPSDNPPI